MKIYEDFVFMLVFIGRMCVCVCVCGRVLCILTLLSFVVASLSLGEIVEYLVDERKALLVEGRGTVAAAAAAADLLQ